MGFFLGIYILHHGDYNTQLYILSYTVLLQQKHPYNYTSRFSSNTTVNQGYLVVIFIFIIQNKCLFTINLFTLLFY